MTQINKQDTRLFVSSTLQKISGDDTEFVIQLGQQVQFKRMLLQSCTMDNVFTNFYQQWSYFNIQTEAGLVQIKCDQYIINENYIEYLNNMLNVAGSTLVLQEASNELPTYDKRLKIKANQTFSMIGLGFAKLGFLVNQVDGNDDYIMQNEWIGQQCSDFSQSGSYQIEFGNLPNAHQSANGLFSFQIINNSQFAGRIVYQHQNIFSNQQIILDNPVQLDKLVIRILDCELRKALTINQNSNDIEIIMVFSLYME